MVLPPSEAWRRALVAGRMGPRFRGDDRFIWTWYASRARPVGGLYVFVFDLEGTLMASGGFPNAVGRNLVIGYHEPSATQVRNLIQVAKAQGQGWSEYIWRNPCTGRRETKISYVIKVGDLVVGVGAYLREGV